MSLLILLAIQAAGQEIKTFYPLPPKEQQERELRKAQGLPVKEPAAAAQPPKPVQPPPPPGPIEVVSVKTVPADANVVFVPDADAQQKPK